jgi:hypothetical protein
MRIWIPLIQVIRKLITIKSREIQPKIPGGRPGPAFAKKGIY